MAIENRICTGVIFATPMIREWVSLEYDQAMAETCWHLGRLGIPFGAVKVAGEDHAQARNKLLTMFLENFPQASDLFWIDDDVGSWDAIKVTHWLRRPEDIIAGIYRVKDADDEIDFPVDLVTENGVLVERDDLILANKVPGGFIRMRRHVAEMLAVHANKFTWIDRKSGAEKEYHNVFEMGRGEDGRWWAEDFVMCKKWRDLGGEIWVDPSMPLSHRGGKLWNATLADHLHLYRAKLQEARAA